MKDNYEINKITIAFLFERAYFAKRTIQSKIFRYFSGEHTVVFPKVGDLNTDFVKFYKIDLFVTNTEKYIEKNQGKKQIV